MTAPDSPAFLRIPPFPGSRPVRFVASASGRQDFSDAEVDRLIGLTREARVGGTYWGAQPKLPEPGFALVRVQDAETRAQVVADLGNGQGILCWLASGTNGRGGSEVCVSGLLDPWHLLDTASQVIVDADDELALIAAIAGKPVRLVRDGKVDAPELSSDASVLRDRFRTTCLAGVDYFDPFTGQPISPEEAIAISRFWRRLIDSNRDIAAAFGFAQWKRSTVAPLLWSGANLPFAPRAETLRAGQRVALWRSRTPPGLQSELVARQVDMIEVEDGFIRSAGLGADCVPPLSITVDRLGVHFNPDRPSDLEMLLQEGGLDPELLARADLLRELIVNSGVSKYGTEQSTTARRVDGRRHVLVTGQVEDDRSVLEGGGAVNTNLELLRRARTDAGDSYLLFKPHPDVEAGHRIGAIPDEIALQFADEIVRGEGISALIDMVDEVHVNTSLAGFEALLRGKSVTTHGVPFYAGWGLTRDLGPVPARRTRRRTLDELVAAVLLVYPRYLDPETGLPCPPEILIRRLSNPTIPPRKTAIVRLRRLQGRLKRLLTTIPKR